MLVDGKRAGLDLPDDARDKLMAVSIGRSARVTCPQQDQYPVEEEAFGGLLGVQQELQRRKGICKLPFAVTPDRRVSQGTVAFTLEELKGIPEDVITGYTKTAGANGSPDTYAITFKTPDIFPVVCAFDMELAGELINSFIRVVQIRSRSQRSPKGVRGL